MSNKKIDCLFVNPAASSVIYQELSNKYAAIEPPTWSLLLAESCRAKGFNVGILDPNALRLSDEETIHKIIEADPRLICMVVYGQNPNSGTTEMEGATRLIKRLKLEYPHLNTCFVGSHTSALPLEVLSLEYVDFVLLNEGVYALQNLLRSNLKDNLERIKGIGYKKDGVPVLNSPERIVPTELMDIDLPGYAWDLLPYKNKPLDLYRSHYWHASWRDENRTPFAAIYSSLGCMFKCDFCMINILNRTDNADNIASADSAIMRFWSPEFMIKEIDKLVNMGVKTLRLSDEMFLLNRQYFEPLLKLIIERGYGDILQMWAYARIDVTDRYKDLELLSKAGMMGLGFGIESGSQSVRKEISKGTFQENNVRKVAERCRDHGIVPGANYIFGLPNDTIETMQETLNLSLELCTENWNAYACYALPGSPLYRQAKANGIALPTKYSEYSFFSYDSMPLPTKTLTSAQVLKFRDDAFHTYYTYPPFHSLLEKRFGVEAKNNVIEMEKIRLKRKILGD